MFAFLMKQRQRSQRERPSRRRLDFLDCDAPVQDVERLLRDGYRRAGNWGLHQICEHLAIVMEGSLDGFVFQWSWFWRKVIGPPIIRFVMRARWIKQGLQAPHPSFLPKGNLSEAEAVQRFRRALERVRTHAGSFHPHPVLGKLTPEEWRQIHLIHAAYHLSFLVPKEIGSADTDLRPADTSMLTDTGQTS